MGNGFPHNFVRILLHPIENSTIRLEVSPETANCRAGLEELMFIVEWNGASDAWDGVKVGGFTVDGTKVPTNGDDEVPIPKDDKTVHRIDFAEYIPSDTRKDCKYEIHFYRTSPAETIVLDPTVILRPGDWVPERDG
jgi:hypothetical protein